MNTRNNGVYQIGFYQQLSNQGVNQPSTIGSREEKKQPNGFKKFTNKINEQILKKLFYSRKTSPICICKIEIGDNIYDYLKKELNVSGLFKANNLFNESFQIKRKRFINVRNYCDFDIDMFQVRISKKKPFKYFDENMVNNQIKQSSVFVCKYKRRKHVIKNI